MKSVLDHGYVKLVETWGSDERVIESARMSTQGGFRGWGSDEKPGDEKLLRYLWEHKHDTPFEFAGMVVEVQAPIFVVREWHRHRTQSYNEMSARYTPLPDLNYVPSLQRLLQRDAQNKQASAASGAPALTLAGAQDFCDELRRSYAAVEARYQAALAAGVPKELARAMLPVGRYTRMRAAANLRNWFAFLRLRMDRAAQWEIRQYADAVADLVAASFPRAWQLFSETRP
jgi:thymidylate synthase (FAD)